MITSQSWREKYDQIDVLLLYHRTGKTSEKLKVTGEALKVGLAGPPVVRTLTPHGRSS